MLKTICQQEAVRCNTQGGVMVKATPASSLVVAQAELLLKLLIVSFNAPAHFGCLDQLHKRGINGHRRRRGSKAAAAREYECGLGHRTDRSRQNHDTATMDPPDGDIRRDVR